MGQVFELEVRDGALWTSPVSPDYSRDSHWCAAVHRDPSKPSALGRRWLAVVREARTASRTVILFAKANDLDGEEEVWVIEGGMPAVRLSWRLDHGRMKASQKR